MTSLQRWIARWNAYWFPLGSPVNLAAVRIIAVGAQIYWLLPLLRHNVNLATKNTEFLDPQIVVRLITAVVPKEVAFSPDAITAIHWVTIAAGLTAMVGLFTRTSLFVFAAGVWVIISHLYSFADVHHRQALFAIFLMLLPFAPSGARLSVDALLRRRREQREGLAPSDELVDTAVWPLRLLHVLLAVTYFSTGMAKVLSGGMAWVNGYTLQQYIFSDATTSKLPLGIWLSQNYTLCVLLAVATILFEVGYPVSLYFRRTAPLWFISAIGFHIGLYVTSGHPFFEHMMMNALLLFFLDRDWLPSLLHRTDAPLAGSPRPAT